jgi:hypothetical protein
MNLWDEIRVFFSNNRLARHRQRLALFRHDSSEAPALGAGGRSDGGRPDQRGRTQVNSAAFAKNSPDANVGHDVLAIQRIRIL